MRLLETLTDAKVINRLLKLMEKMVKSLKNPAKDTNGNWEVTFFDGLVFTKPGSNSIPNLVSIEINENSPYTKPIRDIWPSVNFSLDITELEPLLEFLTKAQAPSKVELYDDQISFHLDNGTSRTFQVNMKSVDAYNDLLTKLEEQHTETSIKDYDLDYDFMEESFGGRGTTNILELNIDLGGGEIRYGTFNPDGINTRILRKNVVGVNKTTRKIPGTLETESVFSPTTVTFMDNKVSPDRGYILLTVDSSYYIVEQLYIVYKV